MTADEPPGVEAILSAALADVRQNPADGHQIAALAAKRLTCIASQAVALTLVPASSITPRAVTWAFDRRIPTGAVTLVAGREGLGKSLLVAQWVAELSRGRLPGAYEGSPRATIWIGTEDDREAVLVPRLMAAGADLELVRIVTMTDGAVFDIAHHLQALDRAIDQLDVPVGLIVIDPLDAHLGAVDSHRKAEVQQAMSRLAGFAQERDLAVLGIAHLNKAAGLDVLMRVVGSIGFVSAARSVLAVAENPADPDGRERVCVLAKSNLAEKADVPAAIFKNEPHTLLIGKDLVIKTAKTVKVREESGFDLAGLLAPVDTEARSKLDEAVDWLRDRLADGPRRTQDLKAMAEVEGHAWRTVQRAAPKLGVVWEKDDTARGRPSTWSLPGMAPSSEGYAPSVMRQDGLAHNHDASDQGKQSDCDGYAPNSGLAHNPISDPNPGTLGPTPDLSGNEAWAS